MLRKDERGYTMMEVIGVLGFLAMLSGGVFSAIKTATARMKTQQSVSQVARILKSSRNIFAADQKRPAGESASVSPATLVKLGVYEQTDLGGTKAFSPYGTEMKFVLCLPGDDNAVCDKDPLYPYFSLTYTKIPPRVCVDLLAGDWGTDPSSGLKSIKVGNTLFTWENKDYYLPPSPDKAIIICTGRDETDITWSYYL